MTTKNGRALLFGANGQLGYELTSILENHFQTELIIPDRRQYDFNNPKALRKLIREKNPEVIINAAAYTAVDGAEADSENAEIVNVDAPRILAKEAQALGAVLVHYSTDYVFDGKKNDPYLENDCPNPQSVYGRTKLAGERVVAENCARYLIFRTSWVFGNHGHNFIKTVLRLADKGNDLRIVADQRGTPTSAALIAEITVHVLSTLSQAAANDERWGLYHVTASGETSWHEYARYIINKANFLNIPLKATLENVVAITTAEYQTSAMRPANSCLDTGKIRKVFGLQIPDWRARVDQVIGELAQ
jgi:dTDP-4-dehydrorhamnose reductase